MMYVDASQLYIVTRQSNRCATLEDLTICIQDRYYVVNDVSNVLKCNPKRTEIFSSLQIGRKIRILSLARKNNILRVYYFGRNNSEPEPITPVLNWLIKHDKILCFTAKTEKLISLLCRLHTDASVIAVSALKGSWDIVKHAS